MINVRKTREAAGIPEQSIKFTLESQKGEELDTLEKAREAFSRAPAGSTEETKAWEKYLSLSTTLPRKLGKRTVKRRASMRRKQT